MNMYEAKELVQKDYPGQVVKNGFEYGGYFYFCVGERETGGVHAVDPKTGTITGALPIMLLLEDDGFAKALEESSRVMHQLNDDFLAHHGIKGQKWGVRRFQNEDGTLTSEGKERYSKGKRKEGLVPVVSLSILATSWAITGVRAGIRSHNKKKGDSILDQKNVADTSVKFSNSRQPRAIESDHTPEQDMMKINDLYKSTRPQTQNNCVLCSASMEARRRGYDVCARTSPKGLPTEEVLSKGFVPPPKEDRLFGLTDAQAMSLLFDKRRFSDVETAMLSKYPEGSRGVMAAAGKNQAVGHAVAFEISGGKVIVYDAQSGKKYDLNEQNVLTKNFKASSAKVYRLDDKQFNWDGMNGICAERKKVS